MSSYLPTIFGENLMDVFDGFDRSFFRNFGSMDRALYGKHAQNMMKTDVKETDDGYEVDIDLPGFKKDEIQLELNNGYLTISTQKALEKDEKNKKGRMLRQERYAGTSPRRTSRPAMRAAFCTWSCPRRTRRRCLKRRPFRSRAKTNFPAGISPGREGRWPRPLS